MKKTKKQLSSMVFISFHFTSRFPPSIRPSSSCKETQETRWPHLLGASFELDHPSFKIPNRLIQKYQTFKSAFEESLINQSKYAPRDSFAPRANRAAAHARSIKPTTPSTAATAAASSATATAAAAVGRTAPAVLRTRMAPEHEHWFAAFFV